MHNFCNHGYIFERRFRSFLLQERIDVMTLVIRDNIMDQFSFYLKSLA